MARHLALDAEALPRSTQHDYWQIRAGPFRVDTALLSLPGIFISSEEVNTLVRSRGVSPPNYLSLAIAQGGTRPARLNGRTVNAGQAILLGSECELDSVVDGGGSLRLTVLREGLSELFLNEPDAPALVERWISSRTGLLRADPGAVLRLGTFIRALLRSRGCATPELAVHAADSARSLLERVLLGSTAEPPRRGRGRPSERRRMALAAEQVMLAETNRPVSVRTVCAAIGASERALELAFREHFGVAPARYFRAVRLHRARRDLLSAGPGRTVTHVAYRHGFWHLPRFAAHYRMMFQELPSTTLARGRAGAVHSAGARRRRPTGA